MSSRDDIEKLFKDALFLSEKQNPDFGSLKIIESEEEYKKMTISAEQIDTKKQIELLKRKLRKCKNVKNAKMKDVNDKNALKRAEIRKQIDILNKKIESEQL